MPSFLPPPIEFLGKVIGNDVFEKLLKTKGLQAASQAEAAARFPIKLTVEDIFNRQLGPRYPDATSTVNKIRFFSKGFQDEPLAKGQYDPETSNILLGPKSLDMLPEIVSHEFGHHVDRTGQERLGMNLDWNYELPYFDRPQERIAWPWGRIESSLYDAKLDRQPWLFDEPEVANTIWDNTNARMDLNAEYFAKEAADDTKHALNPHYQAIKAALEGEEGTSVLHRLNQLRQPKLFPELE